MRLLRAASVHRIAACSSCGGIMQCWQCYLSVNNMFISLAPHAAAQAVQPGGHTSLSPCAGRLPAPADGGFQETGGLLVYEDTALLKGPSVAPGGGLQYAEQDAADAGVDETRGFVLYEDTALLQCPGSPAGGHVWPCLL